MSIDISFTRIPRMTKDGKHSLTFPKDFCTAMPIHEAFQGRILHKLLTIAIERPEVLSDFKNNWFIDGNYPVSDPIGLLDGISIPFIGKITNDAERVEPPFFPYDFLLKSPRPGENLIIYDWGDAPNALSKGTRGGKYEVPQELESSLQKEILSLHHRLAGFGDLYNGPWTSGTFERISSRIHNLSKERTLRDILREEEIKQTLYDLARYHVLDTFFRGHVSKGKLEKYADVKGLFLGNKEIPSYSLAHSSLKSGIALCEEYLSETEPRAVGWGLEYKPA